MLIMSNQFCILVQKKTEEINIQQYLIALFDLLIVYNQSLH